MLATVIAERAVRQWLGLKHAVDQAVEIRDLKREVTAQTTTINRLLVALEVASRINSMTGSSSPSTASDSAARPPKSARPARSSRKRVKRAPRRTPPSPGS
jgi:hypothetical protein